MKYKYLLGSVLAFGSALIAPPTVRAQSILNDLVTHLSFDNTYLNTAAGSSVTATPVGTPSFSAGKIGAGAIRVFIVRADGVNNYVTLGTPPELNFGATTDFSVSFWAKVNTLSGDPSFLSNKNWDSGGNLGWVIATDNGKLIQWNFTEDGLGRADYDGGPIYADGQWHHVVVSYDRDGLASTYVDGVQVDAQTIGPATASVDTGMSINIGQDGTGNYASDLDADIDDIGIWRRALDAADVAGIYSAGTNGLTLEQSVDPVHPVLLSVSPKNGDIDIRTDRSIVASLRDGVAPLDPSTIEMTLNGSVVSVTQDKSGIYTTVTHQPATPLANKTLYTVRLIYGDVTTKLTNTWQFTTVGLEQAAGITGQWDFNSGNLAATIGTALTYIDGPNGATATQTQFGTTTELGVPDINGVPAKVMRFPGATTPTIGLNMAHGAAPNGTPTATLVNQWTLIMDVMVYEDNKWFSFIQTDLSGDGELFKNQGGGIGISGSYQGSLPPREWHRVVFALDLVGAAPVISKFIDGVKVSDQARTAPQENGRHSLRPNAQLFQDENNESQIAYINSVQIRNYKMRDHEVEALGGPSAEGIPTISGQWDFNEGVTTFADGLKATLGADLKYLPNTEFGTSYETDSIGGAPANVLSYLAAAETDGYLVPHGGLPNGGGLRVNQYSLIMDVFYPAGSTGFRSLWQTDTNFPAANDGDLFVNGNNGIGIGRYDGLVTPEAWHRLAFTFDLTKRELGKYIDGTNTLTGPVGGAPLGTGPFQYLSATDGVPDKRWSLDSLAELLADEDGEVKPVKINSVQFRPVVLSADEIRRIGKASATGIPTQIPTDLTVQSITKNEFTYTLSWYGGQPPYQVQSRTSLTEGQWDDYKLPTNDRTIEIETIDFDGPNAFFRVVSQ